jgi:hypothetical protein
MSQLREHVVTLEDPDAWDQFHADMVSAASLASIPGRSVECSNWRPINDRQANYLLTDAEADLLRSDPRVVLVELDLKEIPEIVIRPFGRRVGNYDNTTLLDPSVKNWGLLRSNSIANPFAATTSSQGPFTFNLTGRGVDIVVIDSGVAENHPEFARNPDGTGGSRVVDFDWTTLGVPGVTALSGGSGIKGFLGDCDGHGTNVATIAAGNTCGWAPDAAIYSIRAIPGDPDPSNNIDIVTGNVLGLINVALVFDLVKAFHLAKPVGSNGHRRPTICINSWGGVAYYQNMVQTRWRGSNYSTTSPNSSLGQLGTYHDVRYISLDIAAAEAMAAGVIIVGAAGNSSHKADTIGGQDYNNYWTNGTTAFYYHQGATPGAGVATISGQTWSAICVGALDRTASERKANFSNTGPRVDTYAPGYLIAGGGSMFYSNVADARDPEGIYRISKLTGTSQATPQVSGMLACLAEARPGLDQLSARAWLAANSIQGVLDENPSGGTGYTNRYYLQGGPNRIAHMPYNSDTALAVSGSISGTIPQVAA